jgi:hypothetical protein
VGCCECSDEPSDSIKCWEFFDKLRTCYVSQERTLLHVVSQSVSQSDTTQKAKGNMTGFVTRFRKLRTLIRFPYGSKHLL